MKKTKDCVRIIGIDPGTTKLGWCIIDYSVKTNLRTVMRTGVVKGTYRASKRKGLIEKFYSRLIALEIIEEVLSDLCETFSPDYHASEDAFMNRKFPNAFPALLLCIQCIERLLFRKYESPLYKYAPRRIKSIFAGNGNASKALIKSTTLNSNEIVFKQQSLVDKEKISEHEYDAIAVACTFIDTDFVHIR